MITVHVKPGSRKGPLVEVGADGALTIYVQDRAVDGKANEAVTKLLAAHLGVPRSRGGVGVRCDRAGQAFPGRLRFAVPVQPVGRGSHMTGVN